MTLSLSQLPCPNVWSDFEPSWYHSEDSQFKNASLPVVESKDHVRSRYLTASPYTSPPHLLDLDSVSTSSSLLAQALTRMRAVRSDYATAPYIGAFNWATVFQELKSLVASEKKFRWNKLSFYIVVFRSQIPPTTDRSHLAALDERSHLEAVQSGGLLKYWFGTPDSSGRNLATCVWRDAADAKNGGTGPHHQEAARQTRALYTDWKIERLRLTIEDDVSDFTIVPF